MTGDAGGVAFDDAALPSASVASADEKEGAFALAMTYPMTTPTSRMPRTPKRVRATRVMMPLLVNLNG